MKRWMRFGLCALIAASMIALGTVGNATADSQKDRNKLLKGDYAFTGEASCLIALDGFDPTDLTPLSDSRFVTSFSVQGVVTFNGDGTGARYGSTVSFTHSDRPVILGGAGSDEFQASFTYDVAPDKTTFSTQLSAPLTGKFLSGLRKGQTYTIDKIPLTGMISEDKKSLTLATDEPTIETQTFSNGDVHYRICHRSRVLIRIHD